MLAPESDDECPTLDADLWGVPYLRQIHGLETKTAVAITSALLIAWVLGGARIYDAAAYQAGFSLMFAGIVLSLCLILFAKETYCQQTV
jgi:hypothetical protein